MRNNRKMMAVILVLTMVLSLAACGSKSNQSDGASQANKYANWPAETVTLVAPVKAGGNVDSYARIDAEYFEKATGKSMVVENLNTGGGILGYETVKNAKADGYTLLIYNGSLYTTYYTGLWEFAPLDVFVPIVTTNDKGGSAIVCRADAPYNNLKELCEAAKAAPNTILFGINSASAAEFIAAEIELDGDCKFKKVDAGEAAERLTQILGGILDVGTMSISQASQYEEAGQVKILATTDTTQSQYVKATPACEQGFPHCVYDSQTIIYGPKDMDPELVERINEIFQGIVKDATAVEKSNAGSAPLNVMNVKDSQAEAQAQNDSMKAAADMLGYEYKK